MPFTGKITAQFEHDLIGPANQALVGFNFNTISSKEQCAAAILGYIGGNTGLFAAGTKLVGLQVRAAGAAGSTQMPFPSVEYLALQSINPGVFAVWGGYGAVPGAGGALCPLGTSVSVTENTLTVGPRGRGRHYLPYIQAAIVASNGGVTNGAQSGIRNAYEKAFGFVDIGTGVHAPTVNPAVTRSPVPIGPNPYYDIVNVKVQPVFSNLRSRRR
jgi:hypothetical protein